MNARLAFSLLVLAATLAPGNDAARAAQTAKEPSDLICPSAVPDVRAFNKLTSNPGSSADDVVAAAMKASADYDLCADLLQSNRAIEPMHYTQLQSARYLVVAGRLQRAPNEFEGLAACLVVLAPATDVEIQVAICCQCMGGAVSWIALDRPPEQVECVGDLVLLVRAQL